MTGRGGRRTILNRHRKWVSPVHRRRKLCFVAVVFIANYLAVVALNDVIESVIS